ncbi:hypothetical protein Pmani_033218 [Petrolisthes manimaculis]|uniref:4-hydroxybenzoate polyprenyltransferase, mitochondrial n=1 Tax=Petrolisthes manimaculis TaxID=1843537 RepID=A0AAE1TQA5_9EUCA|nr:hypothetical protein Pmani_033218 [Petrolisthes manimaculis]
MIEPYKNPDYGQALTLAQRGVNACPSTLKAYLQLMRLDRPIGSWLLFWPCGWSLALAAPPGCLPDPTLLALFGLGALVMRGAGCTINDMWDRNIDKQVSRTSSRPLADGTLSLMDATSLLAVQLGIGCCILLQLNFTSVLLGASSLGLVVVYPLMKRVTWFPQLVLGFTFNWGALLGWTATTSTLAPPAFLLYGAGVAWTLIYDTIYAHQDKEDDAQLGIKSTALKFGENTQPCLAVIGAGMVGSLVSMGAAANLAWPYYLSLVPLSGHIIRQIWTLDINDPADCGRKFRSNRHVGILLFLGIVSGTVLKPSQEVERTGEKDTIYRGEAGREERVEL